MKLLKEDNETFKTKIDWGKKYSSVLSIIICGDDICF